jgi:Fe-S cluster biogenesis protein NfuA
MLSTILNRSGGEGWANVVRVGATRDLASDVSDFRASSSSSSSSTCHVRALSFSYPQRSVMEDFAETWRSRAREARAKTTSTAMVGDERESEADDDDEKDEDEDMDDDDLDDYLQMMAGARAAVSSSPPPPLFVDDSGSSGIGGGGGVGGGGGTTTTRDGVVVSPFEKAGANDARIDHRDYEATSEYESSERSSALPEDDGTTPLELNVENVDAVLDEVRPYLISDGGNVSVRSVDEGREGAPRNVYLLLEGACGSCASSTVTMKMGIERVLREKFGEALGEVLQVDPGLDGEGGDAKELTMEAVRAEVDRMSQAIVAMGGVVRIEDVDPEFGVVTIDYRGPNRVRRGLELALLDVEYVRHVKFVSS